MLSDYIIYMKFEWMVLIIICILLFLKIGRNSFKADNTLIFIQVLLLINLVAGFFGNKDGTLFADMFRTNDLIALQKNILNLGVFIISLQANGWLRTHKHMPEFYIILLSTLLGMFFMVSTTNLFMFYLSLELSSIPLAALANFDLEKKRSSEAAMKYIISSAFSSGILLFGISLLYGATGSLQFAEIAAVSGTGNIYVLALIMIIAGFAFKISAVPFHLWTADVYEGSPIAITAYLSVISKGAISFVFLTALYSMFAPMAHTWYLIISILAIATLFVGNLFAIRQDNIKRFLAFSSIAQVGFILVGITSNSPMGTSSVIYFILIYLFSNLGAFGVIALVSQKTGKERISDYRGFYKNNRLLAWVLTISLFSLAGIPPTAGFFGKFFLLLAGANSGNYFLISMAAINMIISLYYYLRIVRAIFMDTEADGMEKVETGLIPGFGMAICLAGIILSGLLGGCYTYISSIAG